MDKQVKEWLERKKQQMNVQRSEPAPPPEPEKALEAEKTVKLEEFVKTEKTKAEPQAKVPVDVNEKISEFVKESAGVPPASEVKEEPKKGGGIKMPELPKFASPEFKLPKLPDIKPKPKKFGINRKRMLIILISSAAGSIAGFMIFLFLIQ